MTNALLAIIALGVFFLIASDFKQQPLRLRPYIKHALLPRSRWYR